MVGVRDRVAARAIAQTRYRRGAVAANTRSPFSPPPPSTYLPIRAQPKVRHFDVGVRIILNQQQIFGFQVAVHDALFVARGHRFDDRLQQRRRARFRVVAALGERVEEFAAGTEFQGEVD